jgi:predicted nuclease of predicted toxin-antitoxin system
MNTYGLRFLIDVGVGRGIEQYLTEEGYDTKAVRDIDHCMEDEKIIRLAHSEKRMVVTMDKDFGELVYHSSMAHCGVLLLRLEDAASPEKLEVVQFIMQHYSDRIKNCFCVFQHDRFRIRKISK